MSPWAERVAKLRAASLQLSEEERAARAEAERRRVEADANERRRNQ